MADHSLPPGLTPRAHSRRFRSRPRDSSTSTNIFNPTANELAPKPRSRKKMKAQLAPPPDLLPSIKPEHLFGGDGFNLAGVKLSHSDGSDPESQEESFNPGTDVAHAFPHPYMRDRTINQFAAMTWLRARRGKPNNPFEKAPKVAAMIVSVEGDGRVRYLPLGVKDRSSSDLTVLPSFRHQIDRLDTGAPSHPTSATYKPNTLPVELFDHIIQYMARDDVRAMRLVCREFEHKVSRALFESSVVPFNTELYDMIDDDTKANIRVSKPRDKGKGKAILHSQSFEDYGGLDLLNASDDKEGKVYKGYGLKVFEGFGPHMKRFGMSFEVAEHILSRLPTKMEFDHVEAYHGAYSWPQSEYARFAGLAGLERTADETSRMKAALANLTHVQELGLSIDSGLGWLNGPDKSLRARILDRPSPLFGSEWRVPRHHTQEAQMFWRAVQQSHNSLVRLQDLRENARDLRLSFCALETAPTDLEGLRDTRYADPSRWPSIDTSNLAHDGMAGMIGKISQYGVIYATFEDALGDNDDITTPFGRATVVPRDLCKEQKEWLLETEWAQRAFLESYMLAVTDNVFQNVTALNIAKLSSSFLPMLGNEAFWQALPLLQHVTLHVCPDWRNVAKDDAGLAQTTPRLPSCAVDLFYNLLLNRTANINSITELNIGWASGGELAEGMCARNQHLLPAPIIGSEYSLATSASPNVIFKQVHRLTLFNCWITSPRLEGLVRSHANHNLQTLVLDSVSLAVHSRDTGLAAQAAQQQHHHNALGANLHHGFPPPWAPPQAPPAPFAGIFGPPPPHPVGQRDTSWLETVNTISPGSSYTALRSADEPSDPPARPPTALKTIEFKSCGYADPDADTPPGEQYLLTPAQPHDRGEWFAKKRRLLQAAMIAVPNDNLMAILVPYMPAWELQALWLGWQLREGWSDAWLAEAATYDGFPPGGTGRFSGIVTKQD